MSALLAPAVPPAAPPVRLRVIVLAILLLAAALRWIEPALIEFKYDEAHITGQALDLARGGALPLLSGGTTVGIQRGALDVYLLALPLKLLGGHVEAALWFAGGLGVLAVALTYLLGRKVGGSAAGLLAALLMAANPWLVFFDRKLWGHIQVVLSVALLLLAWQVIVAGRRKAALAFPFLAAMQITAHVLASLQGLSWLGAFLVAPRRWLHRETAAGSVAGAAWVAPYLWALWRWAAARGGMAGLLASPPQAAPPPEALATPGVALREGARILTGDGIHVLAALTRDASAWWQAAGFLFRPLAVLFAVGLFRLIWRAIRPGPASLGARMLMAWGIGPVALLAFGPLRAALQYWTVLLPLPALLCALGYDGLVQAVTHATLRLRSLAGPQRAAVARSVWAVAMLPVATLVLIWVGSHCGLLHAVERGAGATAFGPPLKRWQAAVAEAHIWADRLGTQEVRVAVNGVDPGYDGEPAVVAVLIGNPPYARFTAPASPPAFLFAHDRPSLYLWAIEDPEAEAKLARIGEQVWDGSLAEGHPPARLYRLPPAATADLGYLRLDPPRVFDAGLALVGYALPEDARDNRPFVATLVWHVLEPPPSVRERDLTAFNHILDAQGERAAQADGMALLSRDWWPGDVLMQPYSLTLPSGIYRWRTGIYSRADGGRAQLVTGGDSVDLPLFEVR